MLSKKEALLEREINRPRLVLSSTVCFLELCFLSHNKQIQAETLKEDAAQFKDNLGKNHRKLCCKKKSYDSQKNLWILIYK